MKKLIVSSAIVLLSVMTPAQAEENGSGCGLGAVVMEGKDGKGANIAASILNILPIPNTFFMTTGGGIMGCDPTQTVQNDEATEIFVARNMDRLATEAAQGGGDYLNVLADLIGIADEDRDAFRKVTQDNFDQLFLNNGDAKRVISTIETAMLNDSNLAKYAIN
ncbi:MAG: hypothetical protein ACI9XK_004057 [Granulosicoccus sp.]|jgi:hypothetical protein